MSDTMTFDEVMAMTPEQVRVEIAKVKEYINIRVGYNDTLWGDKLPVGYQGLEIPDWPNKISSAFALEDELPKENHLNYIGYLIEVVGFQQKEQKNSDTSFWPWIHATAEQRARAWLLTMKGE